MAHTEDSKIGRSLFLLIFIAIFAFSVLAGCGCGSETISEEETKAFAQSFLEECSSFNGNAISEMLSQGYITKNNIPNRLTEETLIKIMGKISDYEIDEAAISIDRNTASIPITLTVDGRRRSYNDNLLIRKGEGVIKVIEFSGFDWMKAGLTQGTVGYTDDEDMFEEIDGARRALDAFIRSCRARDVSTVYLGLSRSMKTRYREPWSPEAFDEIIDPISEFSIDNEPYSVGESEIIFSVEIEFDVRGNPIVSKRQVNVIKEEGAWRMASFPFFKK